MHSKRVGKDATSGWGGTCPAASVFFLGLLDTLASPQPHVHSPGWRLLTCGVRRLLQAHRNCTACAIVVCSVTGLSLTTLDPAFGDVAAWTVAGPLPVGGPAASRSCCLFVGRFVLSAGHRAVPPQSSLELLLRLPSRQCGAYLNEDIVGLTGRGVGLQQVLRAKVKDIGVDLVDMERRLCTAHVLT